ncbi:MAG: hypothetical protein SPJ69_01585 [Campylobacter sp.]|uniref:hypothetical protein n=1 Tax=Campylobacter sp. TaxID=205 RepID=UPI002978DCE8|nr:hypothetical protein [Campylobacter sp.]MDD7600107.1 hypothetical protein [Campylobacteraceae bacterium]MDY5886991.1 hypothetical protein [Campylobacter sp.]
MKNYLNQNTEHSVSMSFSADELDTVLKNRENIDFSLQAMSLVHRLDNANEKYRAEILGEIEDFTPIYVSNRRWKECASLLQTVALLAQLCGVMRTTKSLYQRY